MHVIKAKTISWRPFLHSHLFVHSSSLSVNQFFVSVCYVWSTVRPIRNVCRCELALKGRRGSAWRWTRTVSPRHLHTKIESSTICNQWWRSRTVSIVESRVSDPDQIRIRWVARSRSGTKFWIRIQIWIHVYELALIWKKSNWKTLEKSIFHEIKTTKFFTIV